MERRRFGLPPGGLPGPPSSSHSASRISSMVTGALSPAGALRGQDAIADASDAHDASMARFSEISFPPLVEVRGTVLRDGAP